MSINIENKNFYDGFGKAVTEKEFEQLYNKFKREVDEKYNIKVNELISSINRSTSDDKVKIWLLYDYFTGEDMEYNMSNGTTMDGQRANVIKYDFPPYTHWKIESSTKYPAVLCKKGVCDTFSRAFEDIANRLGIPCKRIYGQTGMQHAWNIVLINGEIKHIDIAYALMGRQNHDKRDYFLKNMDELVKYGGRRLIDKNINMDQLKNDMVNQYNQLHPKITIRNTTDIPRITVKNRTDIPKITINNRSDRTKITFINSEGKSTKKR